MNPTVGGGRPQSRAVLVLAVALTALVTLWLVGGFVLLNYAPSDFGVPPTATPTPSPTGS
jgi:hypothetical protein